jgi:hypothetical protein
LPDKDAESSAGFFHERRELLDLGIWDVSRVFRFRVIAGDEKSPDDIARVIASFKRGTCSWPDVSGNSLNVLIEMCFHFHAVAKHAGKKIIDYSFRFPVQPERGKTILDLVKFIGDFLDMALLHHDLPR